MPRVLQVFEPPDGGVAEHVRLLVLGLRDAGWDVVCAGPQDSPIVDTLSALGVPVYPLPLGPGFGRPVADLRVMRPLARLARACDPDLIHTHSTKAGIAGRIAARRAGLPVVHSPMRGPSRVRSASPRRCWRSASSARWPGVGGRDLRLRPRAPRSDAAPGSARSVARRPQRLHAMPACEPASTRPLCAREGPVVASVSLAASAKARRRLRRRRAADARRGAGGTRRGRRLGPDGSELRAQPAALGLDAEPRFEFLRFTRARGALSRRDGRLALCSDWESLPLGVLEALACGVPQVVTDVGGTGEAVTPDTGILVPRAAPATARRRGRRPATRPGPARGDAAIVARAPSERISAWSGWCARR